MSELLTLKIPAESASRSKMQKKGWKCWAKDVSSIASPANDGYAFSGEFVTPGTTIEIEPGAVILHVDQSECAGIGVVLPNSKGEGWIHWADSAPSEGRKWCAVLGRVGRRLLAMTPEERIREAAGQVADNRPDNRTDEVQAYYERLAGRSPAESTASEPSPAADPKVDAIAQIKRLMAEHSIAIDELQ